MFNFLRQNVSAVSLPSKHEVAWMTEDVSHSPDLGYLEQFEFQLLFSPDETQRGFEKYSLIEDSAFVCTAYTQSNFNFWEERVRTKVGTPIPMLATQPTFGNIFPPSLKIKGEVHAIRPYQFKNLDNHKENRVQFLRKRVRLVVPYREVLNLPEPTEPSVIDGIVQPLPLALMGKQGVLSPYEKVHLIKAWMYVGNPAYWDDILDAGFNSHAFKAVRDHQSRRPWLERYYSYSRERT